MGAAVKDRTFLICPVRGHDPEETRWIVQRLELEYIVHWPPRDTNQEDPTGFRICTDNLNAIKKADVIHVIWDGISTGCLFDLGMAFALGKTVVPIEMPEPTEGKSFQNMVNEWAGRADS